MAIESLQFKSINFAYEEGGSSVFSGMTFDVPVGKNILVTGPPGNGQSTFLKLLAVLVLPQQGSFLVNGEDTTQMSFEEFLPIRRQIGYTFDFGGLFASRTLLDNMTLPLLYHKSCSFDEAVERVRKMGEQFEFTRQINQRPAAVSGGLRKLVCTLRALLLLPEMLVMDDPFTGLDPQSSHRLIHVLGERREKGELKHLYFTSRDEVWPTRLGFEPLMIKDGEPRLIDLKAG